MVTNCFYTGIHYNKFSCKQQITCLTSTFFPYFKMFCIFPQHIPQQIKRRSLMNKSVSYILYIVLSTLTQTCNDHINHLSHCIYWSPVNMYDKVQKYIHMYFVYNVNKCHTYKYEQAMEAFYWLANLHHQYETVHESIPTPVGSGGTSTVCKQSRISAWLLETCSIHSQSQTALFPC